MTVYIDEHGVRHYSIPQIWANTTPVHWDFLESIGWTRIEEELPSDYHDEPVPEKAYSRRSVREKLKFLGLWERVRAMLKADEDVWEELLFSNDLRMSNANFAKMVEEVGKMLPEGMTTDDFLAGCELDLSGLDARR